jgi:hypothetical protein
MKVKESKIEMRLGQASPSPFEDLRGKEDE